jgi:hypothetical protein
MKMIFEDDASRAREFEDFAEKFIKPAVQNDLIGAARLLYGDAYAERVARALAADIVTGFVDNHRPDLREPARANREKPLAE